MEEGKVGEVDGGGRPGHLRALAVERDGRRALKRASREGEGRCPYCGRYPEDGRAACARCRELQRVRNQARSERRRAARVAEERAKGPRRCEHCGSENLAKNGSRHDRPYFQCVDCGRRSAGDGVPPPRPSYPCPYCKGQCRRRQHHGNKTIFSCNACGRHNTNLWPADTPSPGGPFPHNMKFYLDYAAHTGLMAYGQAKGMSDAQAVRDIFIRAATKPVAYVSRGHSARPIAFRYERFATDADDAWDDGEDVVTTVAIPPPAAPTIPAGGVKFPNLVAESSRKFASQKGEARYRPTVLVIRSVALWLNDAALSGLLATMQARGVNHQEAARALLAEASSLTP